MEAPGRGLAFVRRAGPRPRNQGPRGRRRRGDVLPRARARPQLQGHHGQRADAHAAAGNFGGGLDAGVGYFGGVYRGGGVWAIYIGRLGWDLTGAVGEGHVAGSLRIATL